MSNKPVKAKPIFYAICFQRMKEIAMGMGYNLVAHGSLNRDFDLVAIPWVDDPSPHLELLDAFREYLGVVKTLRPNGEQDYCFSKLPGGRYSYVINLNRGEHYNHYFDEEWYLDISFTPLPNK